ncbi:MAG: hypothetical protein RDA78_06350 [Roseibium sp.]|uniref:hypothetical protein n=1 Tax=Roseibium sp. TaxID=1936156 RepID=UPI003D9C4B84
MTNESSVLGALPSIVIPAKRSASRDRGAAMVSILANAEASRSRISVALRPGRR